MEEHLFIKNKMGLNLAGTLYFQNKKRKYPCVILLHGFTGCRKENNIIALGKELAKHGLTALSFDCSGNNESEGNFQTDYRFRNYLDDTKQVIRYAKQLDFVDSNNIGIWGHSMGGQLALWVAAKEKDIKAIAITSAPIQMGRVDYLSKILPQIKKKGYFEKESKTMGCVLKVPYEFFADREKYDVMKIIKEINQPKLIIWGTQDTVVNANETKKIFEESIKPKERAIFEIGHDYKYFPKQIRKVNERILLFFEKCLK